MKRKLKRKKGSTKNNFPVSFPKPKRKKKKKYSQKLADTYFSLLIRHRGICQAKGRDHIRCGGHLQCAHIVSRANKRLRYDEFNSLSLCAGHHRFYTTHGDMWWLDFIPTHYPEEYAYVVRTRNETVRHSSSRLREIIDSLDVRLTHLGIQH